MNWLISTLGSSIGKKLMMAVTGLGFIGFLTVHLVGNLTLYSGQDLFTSYVKQLHALGPLITLAELGLLSFAIIHIVIGTLLFYKNLMARPIRYRVKKNAGGRTIGSATQPYTGFIILAFLILHLLNFHFAEHTNKSLYKLISSVFANPLYVGVYVIAMIVVAIHVSHGFWSLFQTLGANHPKYMPLIQKLGIAVSLVFGIGFGFVPIFISFIA
ncbi:MAG: succinate dehydrogenase cytochrome b subunit [Deltaproteobacteria bacterium]|nr:succinate dehydrogenase cytochrome b subunit [Deltaproteobacteria bacterium]MBW1736819.1 succinate dehydrogenase cytochrome b subunit [Deltaproteobacteria bacterium]MBW1909863.1 succinate dehydrogenase cytochrome b subunit [Deltaproteobacteria bacterium]MBW2033761.1 succinate dehydrogenase cytochrome b subunit [Deltaproteobacteria bacterium]MBW2113845.1 succinate dehydrogenase cytochrome b subunit [Deltaproteobacteria bacterium]